MNSNRVTPAPPPAPARDCGELKEGGGRTKFEKIHNLEPELPPQTSQEAPVDADNAQSEQEFEIEKLVAAGCDEDNARLFKVRWKGYGPHDDTWEPEEALPLDLVQEFELRHKL